MYFSRNSVESSQIVSLPLNLSSHFMMYTYLADKPITFMSKISRASNYNRRVDNYATALLLVFFEQKA